MARTTSDQARHDHVNTVETTSIARFLCFLSHPPSTKPQLLRGSLATRPTSRACVSGAPAHTRRRSRGAGVPTQSVEPPGSRATVLIYAMYNTTYYIYTLYTIHYTLHSTVLDITFQIDLILTEIACNYPNSDLNKAQLYALRSPVCELQNEQKK